MSRAALDASNYACDSIERFTTDGKLDFPDTTFAEILISWASGIDKKNVPSPKTGCLDFYYVVSRGLAEGLMPIAMSEPQFFDACALICQINIGAGQAVPSGMELFASRILAGKLERPKLAHRPRAARFLEQAYVFSLIGTIASDFGLSPTRAEGGKNTDSACDIVSRAMKICGVHKNYNELKNLLTHPDHKRLRCEIEAINTIWLRGQDMRALGQLNSLSPDVIALRQSLDDLTIHQILGTLIDERKV